MEQKDLAETLLKWGEARYGAWWSLMRPGVTLMLHAMKGQYLLGPKFEILPLNPIEVYVSCCDLVYQHLKFQLEVGKK